MLEIPPTYFTKFWDSLTMTFPITENFHQKAQYAPNRIRMYTISFNIWLFFIARNNKYSMILDYLWYFCQFVLTLAFWAGMTTRFFWRIFYRVKTFSPKNCWRQTFVCRRKICSFIEIEVHLIVEVGRRIGS